MIEKKHTIDNSHIYDPIDIIRKRPRMFGVEPPVGPRLAWLLTRDLINYGHVPISVDFVDRWWLIESAKDWLKDSEEDKSGYWDRLVRTSEFGQNSHRAEILLKAFSKGLFTVDRDGIHWITLIAETPDSLDRRVSNLLGSKSFGRAVAFFVE